jgi:hypothetical protein
VHIVHGRALINGCDNGLVEFEIAPPLRTGRGPSTMFVRQQVDSVVPSLVDPDGFITAARPDPTSNRLQRQPGRSGLRLSVEDCRRNRSPSTGPIIDRLLGSPETRPRRRSRRTARW